MDSKKRSALDRIDAKKDLLIDLNDRIWDYAETAFEEYRSVEAICTAMEAEGFTIEKGVGGIETAFTATFGSGRPIIGILAEYDALSGLSQEAGNPVKVPITPGAPGHGCGHNCFAAGSVAAAIGVKTYLEDTEKSGTVVLFGTPGEEGGSGKTFMAREGVFDDIDLALSWHAESYNMVTTGSLNANYQVLYKFKGVSAHAASAEMGRSALDAVALMNAGVQFLREHMQDAARIHYAIMDTGGYSPNVVQPTASVLYLIRSPKVTEVGELYERVNKIARGAAMMTETELEIDFVKACSNVVANEVIGKVLYDNMVAVGAPAYTDEENAFAAELIKSYESGGNDGDKLVNRFGSLVPEEAINEFKKGKPINDFVVPYFFSDKSGAGSSDRGDVSYIAPAGQILVVTTSAGTPGHSWQYVSANKTSIAHKGVLYAGKVLAGAAIDLLNDEKTVEAAKAEHKKRVGDAPYVCPIPKGVKPRPLSKL